MAGGSQRGVGGSPLAAERRGSGAQDVGEVVGGVAAGGAVRVDPDGWDELGDAVLGEHDFPVTVMDLGVVAAALCRLCGYADGGLIGVVALGV